MTRLAPFIVALLAGLLFASALPSLGSGKITTPNASSGAQSQNTGTKVDKDELIQQLATALDAAEKRNQAQERLIGILMENDDEENRALIVMLQRSHAGMKAACDRLMNAEALYREHHRRIDEQTVADQAFMRQMELEQKGAKGKVYAFDWVAMYRATMEQLGRSARSRTDADQVLSNGLGKIVLPKSTVPSRPDDRPQTRPRQQRPALDQTVARR